MKSLTVNHKKNISSSLLEYHRNLKLEGKKRPYKFHKCNSIRTIDEIKSTSLDYIEKFNCIFKKYGVITNEIIKLEKNLMEK